MKNLLDFLLAVPFTIISIPLMLVAYAMKAFVPKPKSGGQVVRMTPYPKMYRNAG